MKYVYILQSEAFPSRYYVGITGCLKNRLIEHNDGRVSHTSKFKPWKVKTYTRFSNEKRAFEFEQYLKTASGRAFTKKHL
jgi:putative endonuclease